MRRHSKELRAALGKRKQEAMRLRIREWRKGRAISRLDRPTNPDRARSLGYKAKQGVVVVRARVRRGGRRKKRPALGRRPKRMGVKKLVPKRSIKLMAEGRVDRRYPNLEVLNSYPSGADGQYRYYEVILLDPSHPAIRKDPSFKWITDPAHKGRVHRGLTHSGKVSRGLSKRGKGSEKARPSVRSRRGKR